MKKLPRWVKYLAGLALVAYFAILVPYIWRKAKENDHRAQAAASASASAKLAALEKEALEKAKAEEAERRFRAEKDQHIIWCRNQGDIPVMGFGFKVVCVKAEAVSWEQKIEGDHP